MIAVAKNKVEVERGTSRITPQFVKALYSDQPVERIKANEEARSFSDADRNTLLTKLTGDIELALNLYAQKIRQNAAQACVETFFGSRLAFFEASSGLSKQLVKDERLRENLRATKLDGIAAVLRDLREQGDIEYLLTEVRFPGAGAENKVGTVFNFLCCSNSGLAILKDVFLRYKLNSWSPGCLLNQWTNPEKKNPVNFFHLIISPYWGAAGLAEPKKHARDNRELVAFIVNSFPNYNNLKDMIAFGSLIDRFSGPYEPSNEPYVDKNIGRKCRLMPESVHLTAGTLAASACGLLESKYLPTQYQPAINFIRYWNCNHEAGKYPQSCKKLSVTVDTIHKTINSFRDAVKYFNRCQQTGRHINLSDRFLKESIEKNLIAHHGDLAKAFQDTSINVGHVIDMFRELADSMLIPALILKYNLYDNIDVIRFLISHRQPATNFIHAAMHRRFIIADISDFTERYHLPHTRRPESICINFDLEWKPLFANYLASNGLLIKCETSAALLREHSTRIGHCVGLGSGYSHKCATMEDQYRGLTHVIGFRDQDGSPVSTIEVELTKANSSNAISPATDIAFKILQWSGYGANTGNRDPSRDNSPIATLVTDAWDEFLEYLASSQLTLNINNIDEAKSSLGGYLEGVTRAEGLFERVGYDPSEARLKETILHWHKALAFSERPLIEKPAIYRQESRSAGFAADAKDDIFVSPATYDIHLCSPVFGSGRVSKLGRPSGPTLSSNFSGFSEQEIQDMDVFSLVEVLLGMNLDEVYEELLRQYRQIPRMR